MLYTLAGRFGATSPNNLRLINSEDMGAYIVRQYPRRKYPAVMPGSKNGAAVHLCAALGIPWLPQTFLVPVRRNRNPHAPKREIEWALPKGRTLLHANPDLQLHHMIDPVHDLLMSPSLAYFRLKLLKLPRAYQEFLSDCLAPGGVIIISDCQYSWPARQLDERFYFQFGGAGGVKPEEYYGGGERIQDFLRTYGDSRRQWDAPAPDGAQPEAEWGFAPELGRDIQAFADKNRRRVWPNAPRRQTRQMQSRHPLPHARESTE